MVSAGQGPGDELVPAGFRLRPDPGARTLAGGKVITGGYPVRMLRLSPAGARHVAGWWEGAPVPANPKARMLARRLLDTGIAHPLLDRATAREPEVTVVVPVRDRRWSLATAAPPRARLYLVPGEGRAECNALRTLRRPR